MRTRGKLRLGGRRRRLVGEEQVASNQNIITLDNVTRMIVRASGTITLGNDLLRVVPLVAVPFVSFPPFLLGIRQRPNDSNIRAAVHHIEFQLPLNGREHFSSGSGPCPREAEEIRNGSSPNGDER